jgi:hypothetical protein
MIINPVFFKWPALIQVLKLIHLIQSGARNVAFLFPQLFSLINKLLENNVVFALRFLYVLHTFDGVTQ